MYLHLLLHVSAELRLQKTQLVTAQMQIQMSHMCLHAMQIRQQEIAARKSVMANPVKMDAVAKAKKEVSCCSLVENVIATSKCHPRA